MNIYDLTATSIIGKEISLSEYKNKVILIVNVASQCGFTPQYEGLEMLYKRHKDKGLVVLGFPSNEFGGQEPSGNDEIKTFCDMTYGVTFPMFAKIRVSGGEAHPLYKHLTTSAKGMLGSTAIKWNFTKFLVDKEGNVIDRYAPTTKPSEIEKDILKLL